MLTGAEINNGVHFLSELQEQFSTIYLDVRDKEERLYTDEVTAQLPYVSKSQPYYKEWNMRQKSTKRVKSYLIKKSRPLKILDLGCGNGWFSNQLSEIPNTEVYGIDVNDVELEQAARLFKKDTTFCLR